MRVTYNWLKEFVDIDINVKDLSRQLTMTGPEVVSITPVGINSDNKEFIHFVKVNECEKHPKADNLKILTINTGKENYQVITNSPTAEKGCFVVFALPGSILPNGLMVKDAEIKGVKSQGMVLAKEQLNIEEKSTDIWILGKIEKHAKKLFDVYTQEDYVMEIELTANRSDCLSIIGIAREIAAMLDKELKINKPVIKDTLDETPDIEILEKNLCPRYTSRILKNIEIKESEDWIKRKLGLCGIRSINNIVDATNYVLLELI